MKHHNFMHNYIIIKKFNKASNDIIYGVIIYLLLQFSVLLPFYFIVINHGLVIFILSLISFIYFLSCWKIL